MTRPLLVLLLGAAALSPACAQTDAERTEQTCTLLCGCEAPPLPGLQKQCMVKCQQDFDVSRVSDNCLACVSANSDRCATLQQVCAPVCSPPQEFPDAPVGVPL